jgi:hypothetical protein
VHECMHSYIHTYYIYIYTHTHTHMSRNVYFVFWFKKISAFVM